MRARPAAEGGKFCRNGINCRGRRPFPEMKNPDFIGQFALRSAPATWSPAQCSSFGLPYRPRIACPTAATDLRLLVEATMRLFTRLAAECDDSAEHATRGCLQRPLSCQVRARTRGGEEAGPVPRGGPKFADVPFPPHSGSLNGRAALPSWASHTLVTETPANVGQQRFPADQPFGCTPLSAAEAQSWK